jgi:hypothetical protein
LRQKPNRRGRNSLHARDRGTIAITAGQKLARQPEDFAAAKLRYLVSSKRHAIQPDRGLSAKPQVLQTGWCAKRYTLLQIVDNHSIYCRQFKKGVA